MIRLGLVGSLSPALPALAPVSVSGIGSERLGRRLRWASAGCMAPASASRASTMTARFIPGRRSMANPTIPPSAVNHFLGRAIPIR